MRALPLFFLLVAFLLVGAPLGVSAQTMPKPDDRVTFDLSAEDWISTKTARLVVNVEAAVQGGAAATLRAEMMKALSDLAKADWKLTSFNRDEDQTGLERWSAQFEGRVPETALNGLHESAKKLSKAGMQLTIVGIDFSPTLEEREAAAAQLRAKIYKNAQQQLTDLNNAIPGRSYRIAAIDFGGMPGGIVPPMPRPVYGMAATKMMAMADAAVAAPAAEPMMDHAEKVTLTARVECAAVSPEGAAPAAPAVTVPAAAH